MALRSAAGMSVANLDSTAKARSAYDSLRHASSSARVTCGYCSGKYRPPSGARPPSRISVKVLTGALPRVEMYFISNVLGLNSSFPLKGEGQDGGETL